MFIIKRNGRKLKGSFQSYEEARRAARSRVRKDYGDSFVDGYGLLRKMSNPPITPFGYHVEKVS